MSDKNDPSNSADRAWESGWDDHERQQLRRLAKLSLEEKLVWLEEANRLVRNMRKASGPGESPSSQESSRP